jgi:hypothetical protein
LIVEVEVKAIEIILKKIKIKKNTPPFFALKLKKISVAA